MIPYLHRRCSFTWLLILISKGKPLALFFFSILLLLVIFGLSQMNKMRFNEDLQHSTFFRFYMENNSGLFDVYQLFIPGCQAVYGLASADFNCDGLMDFVASYATSPFNYSTITIFYNLGNLSFKGVHVIGFNYSYIQDLDTGDYDGDGDIDIVFSFNQYRWYNGLPYNVNGSIVLLYNDGFNHFSNFSVIAERKSKSIMDPDQRINIKMVSKDFDDDGDIDIAFGDNSGKVELLYNDGFGNFTSSGVIEDLGFLSWGITATDFNQNGYLDLIVAAASDNGEQGYIYLLPNNRGCFTGEHIIIANITQPPGTGILTTIKSKNKIELIFGINDEIYLFKNNENTTRPELIYKLPITSKGYIEDLTSGGLSTGDFNNDGYTDFIISGVQGIIRLLLGKEEITT